MKGLGKRRVLVALIVVLGVVPGLARGQDTGVAPPETSYSDQWADLDGQSTPFLNLRNDSSGSPGGPEAPAVEKVNIDGETVVVRGDAEPDQSDTATQNKQRSSDGGSGSTDVSEPEEPSESPQEPTTGTKPDSSKDDASRPTSPERRQGPVAEESGNEEASAEVDRGAQEARGEDEESSSVDEPSKRPEPDEQTEPEPEPEPEPTGRTTNRVVDSLFGRTSPIDTGPVLHTLDVVDSGVPSGTVARGVITSDRKPFRASEYPSPSDPLWWEYYWWIVGGLVVSVMIGMFFWFRRRRVEVVDTSYPSDDSFFRNQLQDQGHPVTTEDLDPPREGGHRPQVSQTEAASFGASSNGDVQHQQLADRLRRRGYDGDFERMLELYYEENMSKDEIAERLSRGTGAVGLVLDYADRLRKEMDHGKRA